MLKRAYFVESEKNRRTLEAPTTDPLVSGYWDSAPRPGRYHLHPPKGVLFFHYF